MHAAAADPTLLFSLVDSGMWQSVTKLFPALVQCIVCKSPEIRLALKDALFQFSDLLQPTFTQ